MGLFKGIRDLKDISDMSKQYQRPSMLEGLSQAKDALQGVQDMQRVGATGVPGTARLLRVTDTGGTLNEHPLCDVELEVTVPGQGTYTTTVRQPIPRMQAPLLAPGAVLAVKVDPADRTIVVLDWQGQAGQAMALAGQATQAATGAGAAQDPVARLERLQSLKDRGLLSDAEFQAQKDRILGEL